MTTNQTIQWIVLPNGPDGDGRLRLSVFVAPRLRTDEGSTLALFPDFLDWPGRMQPDQVSFVVELEDGTQVAANIISQAPDLTLWQALFGPVTPVKPFVFEDLADRPIVTFPVNKLLAFFKQSYTELAHRAADDLPNSVPDSLGDDHAPNLAAVFDPVLDAYSYGLLGPDRDVVVAEDGHRQRPPVGAPDSVISERIGSLLEQARREARNRRGQPGLGNQGLLEPLAVDETQPTNQLQKAFFFHRRPHAEPVELPPTPESAEAHFKDKIDFHQMLSALADYPGMLRRLGLIFDLTIPIDALPLGNVPQRLRILPTWSSNFPARTDPNLTPWTLNYGPWTQFYHIEINNKRFFAAAADGLLSLLPLTPLNFELVQVDVDGLALKALGMGATLVNQLVNPERPVEEPKKSGAPAVRTSGIALVRGGNGQKLHDRFHSQRQQNGALESNPDNPTTLNALDLIRGYRLDVWDATNGNWFSLHERTGVYNALNLPDGPLPLGVDEGFSQLSITAPAEAPNAAADPDSELYVHESVVAWDGWSLSAPRPGASISRDARAPDPDAPETQPQRVPNSAMTEMRLEITSQALAGSLPRLRFGREYQIRVRTADLAGNSLTHAEADDFLAFMAGFNAAGNYLLPAGRPLAYARFEPVPAPALVPRREYGEGESLERLVIRSNYDRAAADYAVELSDLLGEPGRYVPFSDRHTAAPKAALEMVEKHGLLDGPLDARTNGASEAEVRQLLSELYQIAAKESGSFQDVTAATRFVATGTAPDGKQEGYTIHDADQVVLPYLPDPFSGGAVFRGLPGMVEGEPFIVPFDPATGWHDRQPFRLRLEEGSNPPQFDAATRLLTVQMPRGRWVRLHMSSRFDGQPEWMGLLQWCMEALDKGEMAPDDFDHVYQNLKESKHWMFTPWRELVLVNASQQPLEQPFMEIRNLEATPASAVALQRWVGGTAAPISAMVFVDGLSTAKIDLRATWREPQDDPAAPRPLYGDEMIEIKTQVLEIAVPDHETTPFDPRIEQLLSYQDEKVVLFDPAANADVRGMLENELANPLLTAAERGRVQTALAQLDQVRPHEFGDTKYRRVAYQITAASRFREYFPPAIINNADNISRSSNKVVVDVLSSARPAKPKVLYVLPLMRWEESAAADDGKRDSTRFGGGLRVYLDRSWFSSGEGELLGVVVKGYASPTSQLDPQYPFITYWGQDPAWQSAALAGPRVPSFRNAVATGDRITLAERPWNELFNVVGFTPAFDEERRLWYCDMEIDTEEAYFPFVRLALVRYQPMSVAGQEVSAVVLADFVQTLPDRALSMTRDANAPEQLYISLTGPAPSARRDVGTGHILADTNVVRVHLQRRNPAVVDEVLGWEVLEGEPVSLVPALSADGQATWSGNLAVPALDERLRLVVQEFEPYAADTLGAMQEVVGRHDTLRLVYADTIEL